MDGLARPPIAPSSCGRASRPWDTPLRREGGSSVGTPHPARHAAHSFREWMSPGKASGRARAPWRRASLILLVTVSFSLAGRTDERGRRQRPARPLPAFGLTICHLEAQPATLPGLPREAICAGHRVGDVPPRSPSPSESGRPDLSRRSPGRSARLQGDEGECVCGVGSENAISSLITRRAFWPAGSFRTCAPTLRADCPAPGRSAA